MEDNQGRRLLRESGDLSTRNVGKIDALEMEPVIEIEYLTDELCLLPRGVADDRLARLPELRRLAGVPQGTRPTHAASLIRAWLKRAIIAISEPVLFEGATLDRDTQIRAFNLELAIEGNGVNADERRDKVISLVEHHSSIQMWRRVYERRFLNVLAHHLYQFTEAAPVKVSR